VPIGKLIGRSTASTSTLIISRTRRSEIDKFSIFSDGWPGFCFEFLGTPFLTIFKGGTFGLHLSFSRGFQSSLRTAQIPDRSGNYLRCAF